MISPAPAAASGHNGSNGSCRRLHKPFFLSPLKLYNTCLRIPKHPSYLRPWTISGVPILVQQAPFSHLKIIRLSSDSFKQPLYLACHAFARNLYPLDSTKSLKIQCRILTPELIQLFRARAEKEQRNSNNLELNPLSISQAMPN